MVELFFQTTEIKKSCRWLSCQAYAICDLHGWGWFSDERNEAEDIVLSLLGYLESRTGQWSPKEREFLEQMLERLENDEFFIPSIRQLAWMRQLKERTNK